MSEKIKKVRLIHPTKNGYCCACDYDIAVMNDKIKEETKRAGLEGENKVWDFLRKNLGIDLSYQKEIYLRDEALKSSLEEK